MDQLQLHNKIIENIFWTLIHLIIHNDYITYMETGESH